MQHARNPSKISVLISIAPYAEQAIKIRIGQAEMSTEVVNRQWCQMVVGSISLAFSSRSVTGVLKGSNYS
jgi:hypothetical protein